MLRQQGNRFLVTWPKGVLKKNTFGLSAIDEESSDHMPRSKYQVLHPGTWYLVSLWSYTLYPLKARTYSSYRASWRQTIVRVMFDSFGEASLAQKKSPSSRWQSFSSFCIVFLHRLSTFSMKTKTLIIDYTLHPCILAPRIKRQQQQQHS